MDITLEIGENLKFILGSLIVLGGIYKIIVTKIITWR